MASCSNVLNSKTCIGLVSAVCILLVGIADYATGSDINLSIFYLLPIAFVTWFGTQNYGILLSAMATAVSIASNVGFAVHSHAAIPYWNGLVRGAVFLIVVALLSRLKIALLREKEGSRIKSDMLSLVGHLNAGMSSAQDLFSVGRRFIETIGVFFPGCATAIRFLNPETGKLEPLASVNLEEREAPVVPADWLAGTDTPEKNAPRIVRNVQHEPQMWDREFCRRNGLVSYLGLPLMVQRILVGSISLYTREERQFTEEEVSFLTAIAGQAAVALQNARLWQEVHAGHAQLRELSQRLMTVQETDRRQLARELHDEIGQILTVLKLTLEMTDRLPLREASAKLTQAESMVDDLIKRIRGLSLELRPSMLDDLGLLPTLIWHVQRYTATTGVDVDFRHDGLQNRRFAPQVETAAYRIIQEALTNVARHAKIPRVTVNVWCISDSLSLEIQDEGVGFDPEAALLQRRGNGLTGMRERAILLSGDVTIESSPGAGTCVTAQLPLAPFNGNAESNGEDKYSFGGRSPDRS